MDGFFLFVVIRGEVFSVVNHERRRPDDPISDQLEGECEQALGWDYDAVRKCIVS